MNGSDGAKDGLGSKLMVALKPILVFATSTSCMIEVLKRTWLCSIIMVLEGSVINWVNSDDIASDVDSGFCC